MSKYFNQATRTLIMRVVDKSDPNTTIESATWKIDLENTDSSSLLSRFLEVLKHIGYGQNTIIDTIEEHLAVHHNKIVLSDKNSEMEEWAKDYLESLGYEVLKTKGDQNQA